jgi:hypothetical protein
MPQIYTESEQVYEFYVAVPLGITHSKQLSFRKPAKNEYRKNILDDQILESKFISNQKKHLKSHFKALK